MRDTKLANGQRIGRAKGQLDDLGAQLATLRLNEPDPAIADRLDAIIMSVGMAHDDCLVLLAHLNAAGLASR